MSDRISRIVSVPQKARKITKMVLKDMDMRITKSFVPSAVTTHTVSMSPFSRAQLTIADDSFTYALQHKTPYGEWKTVRKENVQGSLQRVENAFIKTVKRLSNIKIK